MPIAETAGARNWGYDGVDLFAPSHHYGTPDDLRRLVDAAHRRGIAVIQDVVYNHLGPDGAYLSAFSRDYYSRHFSGPWGDAVNLSEPGCEHVRGFFVENALHWIHEYHIDGLRLDATHTLVDDSRPHFLAEFSARVRAGAGRPVLLIAEDERNLASLLRQPPHGDGFDAVWADDFHHQMRVALTEERDGYFADFTGRPADIVDTLRQGWFYVGQRTRRSGRARGSDPAGLAPSQFVICLQNHDQIGNRAFGERLHTVVELAAFRAASALLLLAPQVPLLFMGQEWAASTPFLYFTDHEAALGRAVTEGRRQEFAGFAAFSNPETRARIPDPQDPATFASSKLRWSERADGPHAGVEQLYRTLLALRREEPAFRRPVRPADLFALDADTVAMRRGEWTVVTRLRGAGGVSVPAAGEMVLTSEDRQFAERGDVPSFDPASGDIVFSGPAAVLLRR
jgi:maltooligosyltrehalose trehalohydrolase